jgi:hypothetical protein
MQGHERSSGMLERQRAQHAQDRDAQLQCGVEPDWPLGPIGDASQYRAANCQPGEERGQCDRDRVDFDPDNARELPDPQRLVGQRRKP